MVQSASPTNEPLQKQSVFSEQGFAPPLREVRYDRECLKALRGEDEQPLVPRCREREAVLTAFRAGLAVLSRCDDHLRRYQENREMGDLVALHSALKDLKVALPQFRFHNYSPEDFQKLDRDLNRVFDNYHELFWCVYNWSSGIDNQNFSCAVDMEPVAISLEMIRRELQLRTELAGIEGGPQRLLLSEYSERTGLPPPTILQNMLDVRNGLTIDPAKGKPQEGLLGQVSLEAFESTISRRGGHVLSLEKDRQNLGHYIFHTDFHYFPDPGKRALEIVAKDYPGAVQRRKVAWCEEVTISHLGRRLSSRAGIGAYELLHHAMLDSMAVRGIDFLIGRVRGGKCANLAQTAHERVGWRRSNSILECQVGDELIPYDIIFVDVPRAPSRLYDRKPFEDARSQFTF